MPSVTSYKGQKYAELKKDAIASGRPFEDPEFPAADSSLVYTKGKAKNVEWKRPKVWYMGSLDGF